MPTLIGLPDRADTGAFIKGPAVDASMITRMKREAAIVGGLIARPNGRKGTGAVVDGQLTRGFNATSIRSTFLNRGAGIAFFRVL